MYRNEYNLPLPLRPNVKANQRSTTRSPLNHIWLNGSAASPLSIGRISTCVVFIRITIWLLKDAYRGVTAGSYISDPSLCLCRLCVVSGFFSPHAIKSNKLDWFSHSADTKLRPLKCKSDLNILYQRWISLIS